MSPVTKNVKTHFTICPRNSKGDPISETGFSVSGIESVMNGLQVEYTPNKSGEIQLEIKHRDKHISNSPLKIQVESAFDANKITARGPGLETPDEDSETHFIVTPTDKLQLDDLEITSDNNLRIFPLFLHCLHFSRIFQRAKL